jgi:hypothetical protein
MEHSLTFVKKNWALLLIVLIIVVIVSGLSLGYRIAPGLKIVRNGTLSLYNLPTGTIVFTDESRRTNEKNGTVSIALLPGSHTVIVDSPQYQPWNELFMVTDAKETVLNPLYIPTQSKTRAVPAENLSIAQNAIWSGTLPSKAKPLSVAGGCAFVYAEQNNIIAEASTTATGCSIPEFLKSADGSYAPTVVYSAEQLNAVLPFPGRGDTLIIASGVTLYALEIDPRQPQFFRSLAKGTSSVHAGYGSDSVLYASDGTKTVSISLTK